VKKLLSVFCLFVLFPSLARAQHKRDPLTELEVDQLRETAQEPDKRLRLMVKFARARMLAIDQLRSDPKLAQGRGEKVHDLLEDFMNLVDEIDDNVDNYSSKQSDIRKSLKELVEADTDFQLKLRTLKDAAKNDPKIADETKDYEFVLDNTLEAVNQSVDNARKTLDEQNEEFAKKKKK
jgi:regulator of replication initiation timing